MSARHSKKVKIKWGRFLLAVFVIAAGIGALFYFNPFAPKEPVLPPPVPKMPAQSASEDIGAAPKGQELLIRCAGDIMAHMPQVNAAKTGNTYDFYDNYKYVEKYFKEADLMLANFETTFSGDGTYSGYPGFDSPDILTTQVKSAGVNVALFANNHMLDTRLKGARRTVNLLKKQGYLAVVGAREETTDPRSAVVEVKGVKVGLVAYTYETRLVNGRRTMNGSYMENDAPKYINSFRYNGADINAEDLNSIKSEIKWCKDNGADLVICYFHWGTEYRQSPDAADQKLAKFAAENGADIIFASHPHVVQPVKTINVEAQLKEVQREQPEPAAYGEIVRPSKAETKTTYTKTVPIYYSLGNFISNQRYESLGSVYGETTARRTEQGLIGNVRISYNKETGKVTYEEISCIPTWVDRFSSGGRTYYYTVPLLGKFASSAPFTTSGHGSRATSALSAITKLIGEQYIYKVQ